VQWGEFRSHFRLLSELLSWYLKFVLLIALI